MARIAFVQNIAFEYLGVMYLSSVLKKKGHAVELFIVTGNEELVIRDLVRFAPDIVGFSCTTGIHVWALEFAARLKESMPCRVVLGGPHPTYFPDIIQEAHVDIICRGEGEGPLLDIADKIDRGEDLTGTLNCWFKTDAGIIKNEVRPLIEDLDTVPFPDRDMYYKYPFMRLLSTNFIGGRGCPFDCSFCFNHAFKELYRGKGKMVRYRSVDNLIAEMKEVTEKYGLKTLRLTDDTFILDKKWVEEFALKYKKQIGLPFFCTIRADLADENIIKRLSDAGCRTVGFGVESGTEVYRNTLLNKKITDEELKKTAALLKKYGIKFRTYNMLGLPGETVAEAFKTVTLNIELGTDYPWCSLFQPFPGTALARYALEKGFIAGSGENTISPSYFKDSPIRSEHNTEIANLHKFFIYAVKFPRLFPVIKKLIRLKPNFLFNLAFLISYAWVVLKAESRTIREVMIMGRRNIWSMFFSTKKR